MVRTQLKVSFLPYEAEAHIQYDITERYHCDLIDEDFGIAWGIQALRYGPDIAA